MFALAREFARHVVPQILKPLRTMWNQVIGFVFLCFALIQLPAAVRTWRQYNETGEGLVRLVVSALFILIMASFGVTSFLKARKVSRS